MSKVSYVVYEVTARVYRRKDELRPLDDLNGNGVDILQSAEAILKRLEDETNPQTDERYEQAFDVTRHERSQRIIRIWGSAGPYGTAGNLTNIDSGDRRRFGTRDATMIDLRAMLVAPSDERLGLLFCERRSARHLKSVIEKHVLKEIGTETLVRFGVNPLIDPKAWRKFLDEANTYEISYIYRSTRMEDLAPDRRRAGDLRMTASGGVAQRLGREFRSIFSQMTERNDRGNNGHNAVVMQDIPKPAELRPRDEEHFDHERVEMQVGREDARRTIVIERGQLPQFIYELDKEMTDSALWETLSDHASKILSDLGCTLP